MFCLFDRIIVVTKDEHKNGNSDEADKKPMKTDNTSESISASSTKKASGNRNSPKSIFKTNEVKKGNYSSMNGFVIVSKKIVTDYQKKMPYF